MSSLVDLVLSAMRLTSTAAFSGLTGGSIGATAGMGTNSLTNKAKSVAKAKQPASFQAG
jgi:hypothetical protein